MGKKLAIEHHLIRPNEVIELLEMMGGKNKDNADGCSFLYYTLCTPKINNPNNEKVICGFTNLKMQNDFFDIFTLERFWKKYPYKLNDKVLCDDGLLGVVTKMEWDCEKSDMKYYISFKIPVDNKWYSSKNIICKYIEAMEAIRKKLAIKGHPTRGKEVIELLEMLGGSNDQGYIGTNTWKDEYYFLDNGCIRAYDWCDGIKFTLEEFWEKYPFKIGDKVIDEADGCPGVVCEMKWDEYLSDMKYCVAFGNGIDFGWFANDSINFFKIKKNENLEETQSNQDIDKVVDIFRKEFCECCGSQRCSGQDDELVHCERFKNIMDNSGKPSVENHKMGPKSKLPSKYYEDKLEETQSKREYDELRMPLDDDDKLATEATIMDKKILPPDGYLVGKITRTDNGMLVEYVEKKPKYPTTYEECYDEGNTELHFIYVDKDERDLYESFIQLIRCRNAYWKIAGEQMGLDKPWEPDWTNLDQVKYCIWVDIGEFITMINVRGQHILAFPTEEMRDAFFKNFKKEIEQCKELL